MFDVVEVAGEVHQHDKAFVPAGTTEELMQMVLHAVAGEGDAFAFQGRAVVVNQALGKYWDKGIVAQRSLYNALLEMHRLDVSLLPALTDVKLYKSHSHILAGQQLAPRLDDVAQPAHKIPLY